LFGQPSPDGAVVRRGGEEISEDRHETLDIKPDVPGLGSIRIQHLEEPRTLKLTVFPSEASITEQVGQIRIDLYSRMNLIQSWPLYGEGTPLNPIEKGSYRISLVAVKSSREKDRIRPLGSIDMDLT
jgi:hypothetical protein